MENIRVVLKTAEVVNNEHDPRTRYGRTDMSSATPDHWTYSFCAHS